MTNKKKVGAVLVIGGGIGGMQAALDLGDAGFMVYLIDKLPAIGGVMAMLDKTFPTNDCAMCTIAPRLVGTARHNNIQLLTYTEIVSIAGDLGDFEVTLKKKTRYIDESKCTGCGMCAEYCPVEAIDEYNCGLDSRSGVYLSYPQAIPRVFTIDRKKCIGCGTCGNICGRGAVNYLLKDEIKKIEVGAIIAAPGFGLFNPITEFEYGYGRYPNVTTSIEFERILSASGPYRGIVLRPYDGREPKKLAFIQCVGSRTSERPWCSSVCCMYATKHAIIAMEHSPGLKCSIFYMDLRAFGKGFDAYYERAKESGVRYIRCRPSAIKEVSSNRNLKITYEFDGKGVLTEEFDLVVLSCGLEPSLDTRELAQTLGIELNQYGFCSTREFAPLKSNRKGIFVCGPFTEPKDIPETVTQASAAAAEAMACLAEVRGSLIIEKEYPPEQDVSNEDLRIGVFVCNCGRNIGGVVNVPEVSEYAKTLPNVVHAEHNLYTCSTDTQDKIKEAIKEYHLNRVVVASCTPRTHEPLFRQTIREAGLNPYLFEMANIRDQCSWVHMHMPKEATKKSKALLRMAVAKTRLNESLQKRLLPINCSALVIGGGLSGMTAALSLGDQSFEVYLVEKEKELGGHLRHIYYLLAGEDPQKKLIELIKKVNSHPMIHLYTSSEVTKVDGFVGNFKTVIRSQKPEVNLSPFPPLQGGRDKGRGGKETEIEHGVVIVATGAEEYKPTEYLYGLDPRVITQRKLEELIQEVESEKESQKQDEHRALSIEHLSSVVMIQCVGSRDENNAYCSRICCSQAIKNALKLKELYPNIEIFILYRDIRTYGFKEDFYMKARFAGIKFIAYEQEKRPAVSVFDGHLAVSVYDSILESNLQIGCDLLVLSCATVPRENASELAQMLKVPLNQNRFFLEAHMKLRPIDFATEGIFLCGLVHSPKMIDESIAQALGCATRAATILANDKIELEATISEVIDANCDGCAYCIDPCPYKALTLIEYMKNGEIKKTVETNEALCKGCGVCQATCPKKGIIVRNFKLEQISAMVDAALIG